MVDRWSDLYFLLHQNLKVKMVSSHLHPPINIHSRSNSMGVNKTIGNLRVDETLSETTDMGVNKKVYEEQLKLIPSF